MPKLHGRVPKYSLHKASGQALVTLDGKDHYLGEYGSEESHKKYDRLIAEWLANGRLKYEPVAAQPTFTVNDLIAAYWRHAQTYYRKPDGTPTKEIETLRQALKPLIELYGETSANELGPLTLKAVRERMILKGWCRSHINKQISRLKSMFRWGTEQELVPGNVYHTLLAVKGLKRGRTEATESEPVRPVPDEMIATVQPFVSKQVWAMIQLQLFTGARPGEIVNLRGRDIEQRGTVWKCELSEHKTAHHGYTRTIYLGPQAQAIVAPFLGEKTPDEFLFSPGDAEASRRAELNKHRVTWPSCGNVIGSNRKPAPRRQPGKRYSVNSYRRAIERACDLAYPLPAELARIRVKRNTGKATRNETLAEWKGRIGDDAWKRVREWRTAHHWHPHQLRHNAATRIRKERGLEAARAILGHHSMVTTEVYAELDRNLAAETIRELG